MLGRVGSSQGIHRATSPGTDLQSEPCATERGRDGEIQQQPHGADHSVGFL